MSDDLVTTLFDEFRRRHEAGERPDPLDILDRAGEAHDELAGALDLYLADHPAPDPGPEALAALAAEPRFSPPAWSSLLVAAREERRLLRRTAVERLTRALGFGPAAEERVGEHLHGLEAGLLSPASVSERVIDALDTVYAGVGAALRRTRSLAPPSPATSQMAFHRPEVLESPSAASEPSAEIHAPGGADAELTEVDRLFLAG